MLRFSKWTLPFKFCDDDCDCVVAVVVVNDNDDDDDYDGMVTGQWNILQK
jgi:hypothetical protein